MVWTLNDKWQNFSFGSLVRKNILPRVMLVKNIVKSIFSLINLPLQYNNIIFCKKVLSLKYYKKAVTFGNQRGFIMGQRVLTKLQDSRPKTLQVLKISYFKDIFTQDKQVSKIATFGGTSLRIWALNAGLVFKFTSKTVDPVAWIRPWRHLL